MDLKINFDINVVLSFIKKSKMFLLPIVICIVAIIILVPVIIVGGSVKKKAESSKKQGDEISRMLSSDNSYSKQQVQVTESYVNRYKEDVDAVLNMAKQTTQRDLISYNIFPPISTSQQVYTNFGKNCRAAIVSLMDKLGARDAPSDIEKNEATAHLGGAANRVNMEGMGRTVRVNNSSKAVQNVLNALCQKRAAEIPVYANISTFQWYDYWDQFKYTTNDSAITDCWSSQVAFWVYEDVVDTIVNVNKNSSSVSKSIVKRLVDVNFSGQSAVISTSDSMGRGDGNFGFGMGRSQRSSRAGSLSKDAPKYITDIQQSPFGVYDWTTRKCNDKIDVVHFSVNVIIEASKIPVFMKELLSEKTHEYREDYRQSGEVSTFKHNQITIMDYKSVPIDRESFMHVDYRYGDQSVVMLELICEYIFHKDGYEEIIPDVVTASIQASKK